MAQFMSPFHYFSQGLQTGSSFADSILDRKERAEERKQKQRQQQQQQDLEQQKIGLQSDQFQKTFNQQQEQFDVTSGIKQQEADTHKAAQVVKDYQMRREIDALAADKRYRSDLGNLLAGDGDIMDFQKLASDHPDKAKEIGELQIQQRGIQADIGQDVTGALFSAISAGDTDRAKQIIEENGGAMNRLFKKNVKKDLLNQLEEDPEGVKDLIASAHTLAGGKQDDLTDIEKHRAARLTETHDKFVNAQNSINDMEDTQTELRSLMNDVNALKDVTGWADQSITKWAVNAGSSGRDILERLEALKAKAAAPGLRNLKQAGLVGQITEKEFTTAMDSVVRIHPEGQSAQELQRQLKRFNTAMDRTIESANVGRDDSIQKLLKTEKGKEKLAPHFNQLRSTEAGRRSLGYPIPRAVDIQMLKNDPSQSANFKKSFGFLPPTPKR